MHSLEFKAVLQKRIFCYIELMLCIRVNCKLYFKPQREKRISMWKNKQKNLLSNYIEN